MTKLQVEKHSRIENENNTIFIYNDTNTNMMVGRGILTFNVHLAIFVTLNVIRKMKNNTCYTVRTIPKYN